eukprot:scaffold418639_cov13-Prasinocladus_malaysianus.AAC.1
MTKKVTMTHNEEKGKRNKKQQQQERTTAGLATTRQGNSAGRRGRTESASPAAAAVRAAPCHEAAMCSPTRSVYCPSVKASYSFCRLASISASQPCISASVTAPAC